MEKLKSRQDLIALRDECVRAFEAEETKILVCGGTGCVAGGSLEIYARLKELLEERGIPVEVELAHEPHDGVVGMKKAAATASARWDRWFASSRRAGFTQR